MAHIYNRSDTVPKVLFSSHRASIAAESIDISALRPAIRLLQACGAVCSRRGDTLCFDRKLGALADIQGVQMERHCVSYGMLVRVPCAMRRSTMLM